MKVLRKSVSLLLSALILVSVFTVLPITASAATTDVKATSEESGDFRYQLLDDGTAEITGYIGDAEDLVIPDTIDGYTVTSIGDRAFCSCINLESITIPSSVRNIGYLAIGYHYFSIYSDDDGYQSVFYFVKITIKGYSGTEAEKYAEDKNLVFVSLDGGSVTEPSAGASKGFNYRILSDGTAEITSYYGDSLEPEIPSTLKDYTVTRIGNWAFEDRFIKSITIPNSVTSIGEEAFFSCDNLESVTIPESVTSIGESAFYSCTSLKDVDIPNGVTYIGPQTFYKCTSLESVDIPDSVTSIAWYAFQDCTSLKSIEIPKGVTDINTGTFLGCTSLEKVTINNNVTKIGEAAFYGCASLENVTIPESVTSIGEAAFYGCTSFTSIMIPVRVESIDDGAFFNCVNLTDVAFASAIVSHIGYEAFGYYSDDNNDKEDNDDDSDDDKKVDNFNIMGYSGTEVERYANDNGFRFISLGEAPATEAPSTTKPDEDLPPEGITGISGNFGYFVLDDGTAAVYYSTPNSGKTEIEVPSTINGYTVTSINRSAFKDCEYIKSITIPDSVKTIGDYAFSGCKNLESVTIGKNVTSIGKAAFYDCDSLISITIPDSVTSLGAEAFMYCPSLKSAIIGNGVTSLEFWTFYCCESLESVTIGNSVAYIDDSAFNCCDSLPEITIPDSVTSIGDYAFQDCPNLTSVTIPDSVISIGKWAFGLYFDYDIWEDVKMEGFTITGYSGTVAEEYANENGFTFISLGASSTTPEERPSTTKPSEDLPPEEGEYTSGDFDYEILDDGTAEITYYRGDNAELVIPGTLSGYTITSIGSWAFEDCTNLEKVEIPNSVTNIGAGAFYYCSNLWDITIPNSVASIGSWAFENCPRLTSITIPASVTSIGGCAFGYYEDDDTWEEIKIEDFTITGYSGTAAEDYAKENGFEFIDLGEAPSTTEPSESTAVTDPTEETVETEPLESTEVTDPTEETVETEPFESTEATDSTEETVETEPFESTEATDLTDEPAETNPTESAVTTDPTETSSQDLTTEPTAPSATEPGENTLTQPSATTPTQQPSSTQAAAKTDISKWNVAGIFNKTYTGSAVKQDIILVYRNGEYATFTTEYLNNVNAGTATVVLRGTGKYTGTIVRTFKIAKAKQTVYALGKTKTVKYKKVKKAKQTVKNAITVLRNKGAVTYSKVKSGSSKKLTISKSGKITVKKKTKKGYYKIKVKVTAKGNANYCSGSTNVTVIVRVK